MNDLGNIPDQDEILAELENILASDEFRKKTKLPGILKHLVTQALDGEKISEQTIWKFAYPNEEFNSSEKSKVRVAIAEIRKGLSHYYENKGSDNEIQIRLFYDTYTPVFKRLPQSPTPPGTPIGGKTRNVFPIRVLLAVCVLAAAAFAARLFWLNQFGPCNCRVTITDPRSPGTVPRKNVVHAKRESSLWFCRCNDYVVVEAIDIDQWYVQGRLPDGSQTSLTATFGDLNTPNGTRYSVFILSTKNELPTALISRSSPLLDGATKSDPVEVTLENP
jgi:hypothetical protein